MGKELKQLSKAVRRTGHDIAELSRPYEFEYQIKKLKTYIKRLKAIGDETRTVRTNIHGGGTGRD